MELVRYTEEFGYLNEPTEFVCDGCGLTLATIRTETWSEPYALPHTLIDCIQALRERIRVMERQSDTR